MLYDGENGDAMAQQTGWSSLSKPLEEVWLSTRVKAHTAMLTKDGNV